MKKNSNCQSLMVATFLYLLEEIIISTKQIKIFYEIKVVNLMQMNQNDQLSQIQLKIDHYWVLKQTRISFLKTQSTLLCRLLKIQKKILLIHAKVTSFLWIQVA
jgi:hypothetical protein